MYGITKTPRRLAYHGFKSFKQFKSLQPPPSFDVAQDMLSSPASRGRMKEGD
jgi:hypothetical protein